MKIHFGPMKKSFNPMKKKLAQCTATETTLQAGFRTKTQRFLRAMTYVYAKLAIFGKNSKQ